MNSREEKEQIITDFYTAFMNKDAEKMVSYYDDDIVFNDPVFKNLKGEEAKDMWHVTGKCNRFKGFLFKC